METNNFNAQVINAVKNIKGCQFAGIDYVGDVKLTKAQQATLGCISVTKFVSGTFQVNFSYENAVNNRAEKETGDTANFVAQSLSWGAWIDGQVNKLIEHKGEIYLRFYGVKGEKPIVKYYIDGAVATDEQTALLKGWTEKAPSATQSAAGLTENQVVPRAVKVSNITRLTVGGETITREQLAA